jgi:arginine N-succinyltransferase
MFIIRAAIVEDTPTLLKLAKMVHFINLPADPDIIRAKIDRAQKSFKGEEGSEREREFMFVLEDVETGNVVGTSTVIPCLSWPGRPHTFLAVRRREHYSTDLMTGVVHVTLQLGTDETGPSEVGGLVLSPAYRGHEQKLGLLLSFVRFHFIGAHRRLFSERIIAEMMGPLTQDSRSLFWEAFGRRFINLSFAEADLFCQRSKEFITSLLPHEEIYVSLMPPEARNTIGKVGTDTEPAKKLLESIGFRDSGHVDPFDGGPYLEAKVDDIELVKKTSVGKLAPTGRDFPNTGLVSVHRGADFRAIRTIYADAPGGVAIPDTVADVLDVNTGDEIAWTPLMRSTPGTGPSPSSTRSRSVTRHRRAAIPPEAVS